MQQPMNWKIVMKRRRTTPKLADLACNARMALKALENCEKLGSLHPPEAA
jgi:hypothetical protein